MDNQAIRQLDQGVFLLSGPKKTLGILGYVVAIGFLVAAVTMYSGSLSIPDVPQVGEALEMDALHENVSSYTFEPVQAGFESPEYAESAAFITVPLQLKDGHIASDKCTWSEDDDGGGSWSYGFDMEPASKLTWLDVNGKQITAAFSLQGSLNPEGEVIEPPCNHEWYRDIAGYESWYFENSDPHEFNVFMMVEQNPERYQVLSVQEIVDFNDPGTPPQEVTQREDAGRFALAQFGVAGLVFMLSTQPPLRHELRKLRQANKDAVKDVTSSAGILGSSGRYFPHFGANFEPLPFSDTIARSVDDDWLLGSPAPSNFADPYPGDEGGKLIPEHPNLVGTPTPAVITPYTLGAILFAGSFIWLAADLRARDGSSFHTTLGWGLTALVTVVNLLWFRRAWKQFKLTRLIRDLPTSPIRSVAVGQAELVGQVRPSVAGTPAMSVGGRTHNGLAGWQWKSYEYECSTDSEGNRSCSWEHRETKTGGVPFMIHDGSGGMLIDPSLWEGESIDYGPVLSEWRRGDWKWKLSGFGVGDPIYILGDCVPRTNEHLEKWGGHPTLAQALLTMVPTKGTGDQSSFHYGTELDVLAHNRSVFEILLVPLFVFLLSVFMFISYTP